MLNNDQKRRLIKIRKALDNYSEEIKTDTKLVNEMVSIFRNWKPGVYKIDDVRVFENIPYKCCQAHDSTENYDWTPNNTPALWAPYHGTSKDTARPWVEPTGAHDIYQVDEYMIWTDNQVYRCIMATNFSPAAYAQAWELVN